MYVEKNGLQTHKSVKNWTICKNAKFQTHKTLSSVARAGVDRRFQFRLTQWADSGALVVANRIKQPFNIFMSLK